MLLTFSLWIIHARVSRAAVVTNFLWGWGGGLSFFAIIVDCGHVDKVGLELPSVSRKKSTTLPSVVGCEASHYEESPYCILLYNGIAVVFHNESTDCQYVHPSLPGTYCTPSHMDPRRQVWAMERSTLLCLKRRPSKESQAKLSQAHISSVSLVCHIMYLMNIWSKIILDDIWKFF